MFVESFRVENYKSFLDSGDVRLQVGFNVICGRNNVGKSALIEPFNLQTWNNNVHLESAIPKGHEAESASAIFKMVTSGVELRDVILSAPLGQQFSVPRLAGAQAASPTEINSFFSAAIIIIFAKRIGGGSWIVENCIVQDQAVDQNVINIAINADKSMSSAGLGPFPGNMNNLVARLAARSWFSFKAERLAIGDQIIQQGETLAPDAQNLADVLHNFSLTKRTKFASYIVEVSNIIQNVEDVVIRTVIAPYIYPGQLQAQNHPFANISIRLRGASEDRDDLSFSLKESGTGVSQILSIVYVIISSTERKLIVIDEPNSFLNPGAVRNLMDLMERNPQHQYLITTHSAEIIATPSSSISLVTWKDGQSKVTMLSGDNASEIRNVLVEVGVKLSDVFGADEIVWVEGPTEAECFPLIMKVLGLTVSRGTKIIPVASATEIAKNTDKARLIVDIYEKLSSANAIIPPAVAISLDKENFSDEQINSLSKRLGGKVHFLSRRCIENYLISPEAISSVLGDIGFAPVDDTILNKVTAWLSNNAGKLIYKAPANWNGNLTDALYLTKVDGANLLTDLFAEITDSTYVYIKTKHSALILQWLLQHKQSEIVDLISYVKNIFANIRP